MSVSRVRAALVGAFAERLGVLHDVAGDAVPWCSATFEGWRHRIAFEVAADASIDTFAAEIGTAEIALPGAFVADVAVVGRSPADARLRVEIEALTIDA